MGLAIMEIFNMANLAINTLMVLVPTIVAIIVAWLNLNNKLSKVEEKIFYLDKELGLVKVDQNKAKDVENSIQISLAEIKKDILYIKLLLDKNAGTLEKDQS